MQTIEPGSANDPTLVHARPELDRRAVLVATGVGLALSQSSVARSATPLAAATPSPMNPLGPLPPSWINAEVIPLWAGAPPEGGFAPRPVPPASPPGFIRNVAAPNLRVFRPRDSNRHGILLIPSGAYTFIVGTHEGAGTAEAFAAMGYTVFVLTYRLPGEGWSHRWNVPLQDAQRAMRLIRANAARFAIDEAQVAALGYSAGGHIAASLATGFAEPVYAARDAVDAIDARPAAAGLIYPVITMDARLTNPQSATSLLGENPPAALVAMRSVELHVTTVTPPTFLVHALDDLAVPPENSLMMLSALRAAHVPVEAHFFETGGHGFGLGSLAATNSAWPALFHKWLDIHLVQR
ncbi:alpha/beta hydrolase [Glacieibacterium megasporae]|uniref:alpha/beta hydrolase n=1 Tax=Glacieibacterium megasporae TaxID=2835787 RepID=UPI002102B219|nr:alpha/beta hydrolase [Polymorphobacter megasporae]